MRVALFVAALMFEPMLALTTPAQASNSCMSQSEARQHGSVHLYWHGPDHCWDATPGRHRLVRKNQSDVEQQPRVEQQVRGSSRRSDWRQAMSEMLPDDAPVQAPAVGGAGARDMASANWLDRWIDVAQVVPRPQTEHLSESEIASPVLVPESGSGGIPHVVIVLAFFAFLLVFATFEILIRNDKQQK